MMGFAERHGFAEKKVTQVDSVDPSLRNRLFNVIHKYCELSPNIDEELNFVIDKLGCINGRTARDNWKIIDDLLVNIEEDMPWYMPYEIIELFIAAKRKNCSRCKRKNHGLDCNDCDESLWLKYFPRRLNAILEEEKSAYRISNDIFINIVNKEELKSIDQASNSQYATVNTHIKKALELYSDRKTPDYENSIKESISAVESVCCIITGMTGASATLGAALKKLENNGVVIHKALLEAFSKIYGYTSDADGIRHGGINFSNAPAEDAKYMLVSCSAFVNYLIEKYGKIGASCIIQI